MNTRRCFDCLEEFPATAQRFVVVKWPKPTRFHWFGYPVFVCVCADCAGWYRAARLLDED